MLALLVLRFGILVSLVLLGSGSVALLPVIFLAIFGYGYAIIRISDVRSEGYLAAVLMDLGRYGDLMFSVIIASMTLWLPSGFNLTTFSFLPAGLPTCMRTTTCGFCARWLQSTSPATAWTGGRRVSSASPAPSSAAP